MGRNKGKTGVLFGPPRVYRRGCIACRRPIFYGERCDACQKRLRLRRNRKPR
jgi:hypothetical protein